MTMISDEVKQKIKSRSFWGIPQSDNIAPNDQLIRQDYVNEIIALTNMNIVAAILGIRRGGKSVISKQFIQELRSRGTPASNILYLNLFLRHISDLKNESVFMAAIEWWLNDIANEEGKRYLIIDEVQELENWDINVASIFEDHTLDCQIIITGSNSKILSDKLDTSLGGRYTILQVFPFSYIEYCKFTNKTLSQQSFLEYLHEGGMAEPLKASSEEQKERLIQDIINSTVERDIVQRNNVSNPQLLNALIDYCRGMFSREVSIKNIQNEVKRTIRGKHSAPLITEYLEYIEDVFFIQIPKTYSYRAKDVLSRSVDKLYLADTCFAIYEQNKEKGRLLENVIHSELLRAKYKVKRYFAYKNKNLEVDFLAERKDHSMLVQVCWTLGDQSENENLWEREFGNLKETKMNTNKLVVSLDENITSPYPEILHQNAVTFIEYLAKNLSR